MTILPAARPQATRAVVIAAALAQWTALGNTGPLPAVYVVGVPAYYRDTMGQPGVNDRGIYDDAFFVVSENTFTAFNGNCDPSIRRAEIATLRCPQVIWYKPGRHAIGKKTEHNAFRQDSPVIVRRDGLVKPAGYRHPSRGISLGDGYWTDRGYAGTFWTNNHRGGWGTTSSEGCLTVPPSQWDSYYALVMAELKRAKQTRFPMVLIPGPIL